MRKNLLATTSAFAVIAALGPYSANAQQSGAPVSLVCLTATGWQYCSGSNPVPVSGSLTANLGAFAPGGNYATMNPSTVSTAAALPTNTGTIVVYDTGTQNASVKLGGSGVSATASDDQVAAGCFTSFAVGSNTSIAAITSASSTSLIISGGAGLPAIGCSPNISGSNAAASATGSGVPADASYNGVNVGGTLRGQTGVNPTGSVYAGQIDLSSMNGIPLSSPSNYGTAPSGSVAGVNAYVTNTPQVSQSGIWAQNVLEWAGASVAAITAYGTAPSGSVPGVNAYVTNSNANGQATMANSSPVVIASNQSALSVNPGTAVNWGIGATGATPPANAPYWAGDAQSSEPSATTTGSLTGVFLDLTGKQVTSPYANRENYTHGSASVSTTVATTIIASAGSGLKNYITSVQCGRTDAGTTATYVTFNDSASTTMIIPNNGGGGGNNMSFPTPIATAAATAFQVTPNASISTIYCNAQGYKGY